jgi:hypothetical protein
VDRNHKEVKAGSKDRIAKAITRKHGYENQITNTIPKRNESDRL